MSIWWGVYAAAFVATISMTTWWARRCGDERIDRFDKQWSNVYVMALPFFIVAVFSANRVTGHHHDAPIWLIVLTAAIYFLALNGPRLFHNAAIRGTPTPGPGRQAPAPTAKRRRRVK